MLKGRDAVLLLAAVLCCAVLFLAELCLIAPCCGLLCVRSLPLEMVELEKHVPDLNMDQNPLPVLPDKWHVRFGPKEETRRPAGYTNGEVRRTLVLGHPFSIKHSN